MPGPRLNKKQDIIQAATLLFAEQGFDGTTTLQISKQAGMATGEFTAVPVRATANLIVALLNGLMRQRGLKFEEVEGIKQTAVDFCRRSLVNTEFEHG